MLISMKGLLFLITLCFSSDLAHAETKDKYISAILYTKWSETPIALEASEFIFKHNRRSFWNFVYDIAGTGVGSNDANQTIYEAVLDKAKKHLSGNELNFLKLSLSIRAYSPAIEASRKLAEETKSSCLTFVDVHGQTTCNLDEISGLIDNADKNKKPFIYKFDKLHPETQTSSDIAVILYANIATEKFKEFDRKLLDLHKNGKSFNYFLRHNAAADKKRRVPLSGYGVELDIKNTEYKAKDDTKVNEQDGDNRKNQQNAEDDAAIQGFMFNKLKTLHPQLDKDLDEFRKYLLESTEELAPLKAWHIQDLSIQAAQYILETEANDQLDALIDVSQNFPVRARSLSKIAVKKDVRKSLQAHKQNFEVNLNAEPGTGAFYINGLEINLDTFDVFSLTSQLIKEGKLLENLYKIGLNLEQIRSAIYLDLSSKSLDYGIDIRDSSIQWLNDLESDKKYAYWPKSMQEILRPTYPGMLRSIAKNFFNLVLIVDPSKNDAKALLKTVESFYVNDIPIRIGFVFVSSSSDQADGYTDASVALFRAHNYVKTKSNAPKALSFLTDLYARASKNVDLTADLIVKEFKRAYPKEKNLDDVFGVDSDYDEGRKLSMDYFNKIGLRKLPQVIINGFPLKENELENDLFEEAVISKIMQLTQEIQFAYYHGKLHEAHNLMDWLMNKETIMPRLNPRVLSTEKHFIEINEFDDEIRDLVDNKNKYLTHSVNGRDDLASLNLWIVCDPDTDKGRRLLSEAVDFHESNTASRLAVYFQTAQENNLMKQAITYALQNLKSEQARVFIKKILKEKLFNELQNGAKKFSDVQVKDLDTANIDEAIRSVDIESTLMLHEEFIRRQLSFQSPDQIGLVANGWILGPLNEDEVFVDSDFQLLDNFMRKTGLNEMKDLFQQWFRNSNDNHKNSNILLNTYAILGKYSGEDKRTKIKTVDSGFIQIQPKNPSQPSFDAILVIDPLTRFAQKVSPVVKVLTQATNMNLAIYFNCRDKLSGAPLKNFYRYVLEPEMRFKDNVLIEPLAFFHNMPQSPLLTMNMHPPEGWMVEIVRSPFDLDNIYLKEVQTAGAYGEYELEHLIIEGHCFDMMNGQSPRGLQFNLGTMNNPKIYDTIVMANLGYFQLKSSPGSWILQLREGRSQEIYEIVSHENTDSLSRKSAQVTIVMDTFESKIIKIKVSKKAEKMNENLLDDKEDEQAGGIWNSISNTVLGSGNSNKDVDEKEEDNVLNIFSVASGHLYERFLRIMMLTVLKNTKARVKFWFLKNYLSPQLTKFLPHYAEKYNFDYELVQYKWPRWLHHETEKQRIIWGYKILFLDVLFPLSTKKIIFVDADQIVRADLTELRDIDLKGAPYGYTPFCDSRKEMEGYRFWKQGYWSQHLGHRRYHISALYVVDLKKFRKIAAGDRLRGQYQGLSQDPNSLSNLDQDLPNNMIHQVNIFSLPQEWLYCDTWCSSDTLKKAKTIDLCNNPNTKEPKLSAAVRIVPEWKDYDNEIKDLMEKWQQELKQNVSQTKEANDGDKHTEL